MSQNFNNLLNWWVKNGLLSEQDMPTQPSVTNQPPVEAQPPEGQPQQSEPVQEPQQSPDDQTQDPQTPDLQPDKTEDKSDFNSWKKEFFKLAIKGDANEMIDMIGQVRDRKLTAPQKRFIEDNLQILLLRQDANFDKISKEIRKLISQQLDRNNPAVSLMTHLNNSLQAYPQLVNVFIKLAGQGGFKAELHRRMIAAFLGAVEVGGGGEKQDLIYSARDYSIDVSTRFYTTWGDINLGRWMMQEDDPSDILSEPELERLKSGAPEEKRVHRRRIVLESIASKFQSRAFIIHVVDPQDGTIHALGWDIADGLRTGYKEGTLVVRKRKSDMKDIAIEEDGEILPLFSYAIYYKRDTKQVDKTGVSIAEEIPFIEQIDGVLYLTADAKVIEELSGTMPGMVYSSQPYTGNPSDVSSLMRCAPSTIEMLMRRC